MAFSVEKYGNSDLYVMDPRDPSTARMVAEVSGGGWSVANWSHDAKKLLLHEYLSANESRLHVLDLASGTGDLCIDLAKAGYNRCLST